MSVSDPGVLLELDGVSKHYTVKRRRGGKATVRAVDGISITVRRGETYALVGESGSGKTTTARMALLAEQPTTGEIRFRGVAAATLKGAALKRHRSTVTAVYQDPWSSLNPRMRVRDVVAEPLTTHSDLSRREIRARVAELLEEVGLHPEHADRFPHEFSGGQRQRIAIARALALKPDLIVLDEPVSALDVSFKAQIMNLLRKLQRDQGISFLMISHDLASVRFMSDRVGVMYLGKIVEEGDTKELLDRPLHPYTRALIAASLPAAPGQDDQGAVLEGDIPSPLNPPSGCTFHTRCPLAYEHCSIATPVLLDRGGSHIAACHLLDPKAPRPEGLGDIVLTARERKLS